VTTIVNEQMAFIHVPKTGGMWVTDAIRAGGIEFDTMEEDDHFMKSDLEAGDRFVFAFVREPFSWYGSVWRYHRVFPQAHWVDINEAIDLEFPDFLEQMLKNHPGWLSRYYKRFVGPRHDEIDFVGRYERLADDLVTALRSSGQEFDEGSLRALPPVNRFSEEETGASLPDPSSLHRLRLRLYECEREAYERFYEGDYELPLRATMTG
jgi:hypothetical protein